MQFLKISSVVVFSTVLLAACNGLPGKQSPANAAGSSSSGSANPANSTSSAGSADPSSSADQLIDTTKLKSDMNNLLNSVSATGKPDTTQLKKAASDILTTTADVLSDSGISKMGGNSNDPAQASAKETLIKMRNAMGITPGKLDSMRKAAGQLEKN